jgi:aspartyl-tRNA(Asn)/glutamyl-tRNA(Gln) amidotransferase subunit A
VNERNLSRRELLALGTALACRAASAETPELTSLTLKQASDLLRSRAASPVDLVEACLKRTEKLNPLLNAFITVTGEQALRDAREMEAEQKRGRWRGPLHGVPIGLKDNIDTVGIRTTGASELFRDRVPSEDAEVARRLKNAGAILLGKLNLVEFAYGGNSASTAYGTVRNPWALDRSPGGSSSGPAAAVAAGLCYGSLGTDTAGSIRGPASNCGIVGLKPSYGRVSLRGVIPLSWTLDHVGPITRTVEDTALMLNVIAGYDALDPTTAEAPVPDYTRALRLPVAKLRLGRPAGFFDNLHPEVAKSVEAALDVLRRLTSGIRDVQLPASGNPAQVWGPEAYLYHKQWITETPEKYQPATRRSLEGSADAKAEVYVQARRQVDLLRRDIRKVFAQVDLLIVPTSVNPPGRIAEAGAGGAPTAPGAGPGRNNNAPFDVFGLPAISVPCGFTADSLPVGIQIVGAPFAESTVLALAHRYEQSTEWHKKRPPL